MLQVPIHFRVLKMWRYDTVLRKRPLITGCPLITGSVADPGFGGRGGVNCHKQGRSPCSRHEVASGGWVREGGVPPP